MERTSDFMHIEHIFPIGVAAKMIGVSPSTLRMYEKEGLLIPYKTSTKMRLFPEQDIEWIRFLRTLIKKRITGCRRNPADSGACALLENSQLFSGRQRQLFCL